MSRRNSSMDWWEGVDEARVLIAPDPSSTNEDDSGKFLSFRHPKSGDPTCYLFADGTLQEVHWFKQPFGSWFLGDYVCEDGRLYIATPIDPVFVLLPLFEEARMKKKGDDSGMFRQLDEIMYVSDYPGYQYLSSVAEKSMQVVCDFKEMGSTKFFRLNDEKVLKWMCFKVEELRKTLVTLDKNFAARDKKDTLTDTVSIIGEYIKEEPWLNLLCCELRIDLNKETKALGAESIPSSEEGNLLDQQGKNGNDAKNTGTRRQTSKKAKLETNSQNIKDMFSRATRKKK